MAKKTWTVRTDEGIYTVDLKGTKLSINGADPTKLSKFAKKSHFVDTEYTIPLGNRSATLFVPSMSNPVLAYNGVDCETGEPWEYQKIPAWGWVFFVLDIASVLVIGWIWVLLAVLATGAVIRSKMSTGAKLAICLLLAVALWGGGILISLSLAV